MSSDAPTPAPAPDLPLDPWLARHETPMQRRLRRVRPWPVGCVFIQRPGQGEDDIRRHFRLMKSLGFNALKQCLTCRGTDPRRVMHLALDEGVIPFWYGEAAWEEPTPDLLAELGLDPHLPIERLRTEPRGLQRQEAILRRRIDALAAAPPDDPSLEEPEQEAVLPGVPVTPDPELLDAAVPAFVDWLREQYGTIEGLNEAWNLHHCMISGPRGDGGIAPDAPLGWASWEALAAELPGVVNRERREFRRVRDVLRFKADLHLRRVRRGAQLQHRRDPLAPQRAGGEMGLFLPFASRCIDMAGIARVMSEFGSFYPSIHLSWHFEETGFEYVRPMYMQAAIAADWMKGGWSATWESTGGPQQFTGFDAPFVPAVREQVPGFTVDGPVMTQLMLSWIAAGFRGFGLWAWSTRTAGWEAGEYGLLDRNNRPTPRAQVAGRIGAACQKWRDELWEARKEPQVGVFVDWDSEAMWAAVSRCSRSILKSRGVLGRIGAARALINGNVPFEHVTADDLRAGLASRYRVILLPAVLAIAEDLWPILDRFVRDGGRLVLDAPGGWYDTFGRLLLSDDGTPFERLFGCRVSDTQFSRAGNAVWSVDGRTLDGGVFDLQPTGAGVRATFGHGAPAVTEHRLGAGTAVVIAWEASLACAREGQSWAEAQLRRHALGDVQPPIRCPDAIVYHLAAPAADHLFVISDGPARDARVEFDKPVRSWTDAITGEPVDLVRVRLPERSGRWLRGER